MMEAALALADRRMALAKREPLCPACGARQVQLIDYTTSPALWKCRECKHKWAYEPEGETK